MKVWYLQQSMCVLHIYLSKCGPGVARDVVHQYSLLRRRSELHPQSTIGHEASTSLYLELHGYLGENMYHIRV